MVHNRVVIIMARRQRAAYAACAAAAAAVLLGAAPAPVAAVYLPGATPTDYKEGDAVRAPGPAFPAWAGPAPFSPPPRVKRPLSPPAPPRPLAPPLALRADPDVCEQDLVVEDAAALQLLQPPLLQADVSRSAPLSPPALALPAHRAPPTTCPRPPQAHRDGA